MAMDEKICPICGKPNNCKYDEGNCWCKDVVVPKKVLDMVPDDKKGKACICKSCIEKYSKQ
ncbi:MAG TPA: cysteine-rich CWC family protein [Clostridiales bacterium]|nr:cysteine-rich CWC family protein [Clostridiales bacterium]